MSSITIDLATDLGLLYVIERNEDIDKIEISSLKQWVREWSTNSEATPTKPND